MHIRAGEIAVRLHAMRLTCLTAFGKKKQLIMFVTGSNLVCLCVPVTRSFVAITSRNNDGMHSASRGRKHNGVRLSCLALEGDRLVIVTEIRDFASNNTVGRELC